MIYISEKGFLKEKILHTKIVLTENFAKICEESLALRDPLQIVNYSSMVKKIDKDIVYAVYEGLDGRIMSGQKRSLTNDALRDKAVFSGQERISAYSYKNNGGEIVTEIGMQVVSAGRDAGTVRIGFSQKAIDVQVEKTLMDLQKRIMTVGTVVLFIGILASMAMAFTVTKPINKLAQGAKMIGEGNLETHIDIKSSSEIGTLAREFNEMALKLAELDRLKSDFVATVSHELRSPLSYIKGYIELFLGETEDSMTDSQKEYFMIVKKNITRLSQFINDILDVAKIEAGQIMVKCELRDIKPIVEEMITFCKPGTEQKNIDVGINIGEEIPNVLVDGEKIKHVITNLVNNALKFTPEGGKIRVCAAYNQSDTVTISVSDTGIGIPEDDLKTVFNKFHQVKANQEKIKDIKGTGLGLAIARGIVEAHGGIIWVESEVSKGTTFSFTLKTG
ncbi:MAG: HAMP domain-containing sensor histidine kinase [Elusimicrobiota bacterium]